MPEMLADRKTTVSYAIDLLRAHQLRRENAFLHEEVQACRKEIVAMHGDLKEMKSTVQECYAVSTRACSLSEEYKVRLGEQARDIDLLKEAYQSGTLSARAEVEVFRIEYEKNQKNAQAELALIRKEFQLVQLDCKRRGDEHNKQFEDVEASVAALQVLVDEKPDMALLEALRTRVNELTLPEPVPGLGSRSACRVPDSFERKSGSSGIVRLLPDLFSRCKRSPSSRLPACNRT